MNIQIEPLEFISLLRNSFEGSVKVYTQGSCYQMFLILKALYPSAIAFYDSDHIITKIGEKYYDITGEVQKQNHIDLDFYYGESKIKKCKFKMK